MPSWESRAVLEMETEVSLSPRITVTTPAMGQVQGQKPLTRPLTAIPPSIFDQGMRAGPKNRQPKPSERAELADAAGVLRALPVP